MPVPLIVFSAAAAGVFAYAAVTLLQQFLHRRHVERELLELITQNQYQFTVLDVRDSKEFHRGHVLTASNIPFSQPKKYFPSENMFERIFVFGPNHRKAWLTARRLSKDGYFNVTYYGAYHHWKGPKSKDI